MATSIPAARIHAPGDIRLDRVSPPTISDDDVLVRVHYCGICGSDISYARLGGIPGAHQPFAIGHEFSGVVEATGANVRQLKPGDRVVINPEAGGNGIGSSGFQGAFAPFVAVRDVVHHPQSVLPLPGELDFELGALVEPLAVGRHAANQGRIAPGETVAVFGAGPVGLAAAIAARHLGAEQVCVIDRSEYRLGIATALGLETLLASEAADFSAAGLKSLHGSVANDPRLGEQPGTDLYIEATGAGPVFQQICGTARKGGRIVVVGVHFAPVELDMVNMLMRELQITAAMEYPREFPQVLEMLQSGSVDVRPLISHSFPLSRFDDAFSQARRQDEALKVLVDCQH